MLKNTFKQLVKFVLVVLFGLSFTTSAFAYGTITGNNTPETASSMGYWKYYSPTTTILATDQNESYYTFTAYADEQVYVRSSYDNADVGMSLEVRDSNQNIIGNGDEVINPTSFTPFIFASVNRVSNSNTFLIKVTRGNNIGNIYFTVSVYNRINTGNETFNFIGTSTNPGNPNYLANPDGVDSSIISMDLTNNSTVPIGATVKSITTSSRLYPSLGGIIHKISPILTNVWYDSTIASATSGYYNISLSDELPVAQQWDFRYNFKGASSSSMRNVKATINYEFDVTQQF